MALFPNAQVRHLPHLFSNHCPLLIQTEIDVGNPQFKCFQFESWWVLEETFELRVRDLQGEGDEDVLTKLDRVREGLDKWAQEIRCKNRGVKKELSRKLEVLLEEDKMMTILQS